MRGALFCCITGSNVDGHDFAPAAVDAGAVALLCERSVVPSVPQLVVRSTRAAMGPIASTVHGSPSRALDVVGVTGTNGKTTTTHLLRSILDASGRLARVIGTLTGARTTPEATDLQRQLASFRDEGVRAVAMEVSSHALAQHRVDGTWFAVGVFTNLSRDHLDFHESMDDYFDAKAQLFDADRCGFAVVNTADEWGRRLVERLTIPWESCSLDLVHDVEVHAGWSQARWNDVTLQVPFGGRFNLENALAAAVAARALGIEPDAIAVGIRDAGPVPGRFELVHAGQPFSLVVDYAHTPDGLEQVLVAAREVAGEHAVLAVFGCGGDRDRTKRPLMGAVAQGLADQVILTSDNPRDEDPSTIIDEVLTGITDRTNVVIELDRRAAIQRAIAAAHPGDVVVVAGKGHETTQTIGESVLPFDDREVARELLEERAWSAC
jgi:UDP-N-acetylmuramoyl-L-alanyl-D-glutamate--2,6-diaminopimelate ligase